MTFSTVGNVYPIDAIIDLTLLLTKFNNAYLVGDYVVETSEYIVCDVRRCLRIVGSLLKTWSDPETWTYKPLTNFRKIFVKSSHLRPKSTSYDFASFSCEFLHARLMFS